MSEKILMKGNEAIAYGAIRCGCDGYFGYPITPQSEIMETLMELQPWESTGMVVLQAESETASINMLYGDDIVQQPGNKPDVRRAQLSGGSRIAVSCRKCDERRPGTGNHSTEPGRLLPMRKGRRPWRLPDDRACSRLCTGHV